MKNQWSKKNLAADHGGLVDLKVSRKPSGLLVAIMPATAALRMGFTPNSQVVVLADPKADPEKPKLGPGKWACTPLCVLDGDSVRTQVQAVMPV